MAIGTSSGKTYDTQFEEVIDQPVQMAGKDLDRRTPEPLPILPPVHSIAPHNPNPPGGGYEIRPGERLSSADTTDKSLPTMTFNWEGRENKPHGPGGDLNDASEGVRIDPPVQYKGKEKEYWDYIIKGLEEHSQSEIGHSDFDVPFEKQFEIYNQASEFHRNANRDLREYFKNHPDVDRLNEYMIPGQDNPPTGNVPFHFKTKGTEAEGNTKLAMEDRRQGILSDATPLGGRIRGGEGGAGGGGVPRYAPTLEFARDRPNERELLQSRVRQIEYDRRLSGKPEEGYPYHHELSELRKRLKELK